MEETRRIPANKMKTISLDGVEFTIYTQRFENRPDELYVGGWAVDLRNDHKWRIWGSEQLEESDLPWEQWISEDN